MISNETVRLILETAQTEDVVSEFVTLKKRGANLLGLCPFHHEKTPSFTVSPAKNLYKCFGCGKGGDAVSFLREHEQMSFEDALRWLAEKYNIPIEERDQTPEEALAADEAERLHGLMSYVTQFYHEQLNTETGHKIGVAYFRERGLEQRTIDRFELGYAPRGALLASELEKFNYDIGWLQSVGLLNKGGMDFFGDRVLFPIHSLSGKHIALAGRQLRSDHGPKYLNSPESPIYNKSRVLYAMHLAKGEIRKKDKCYLVEGYMDVLTLHQNGITNVVATSGTALTTQHAALLKRFTENVTLLFDGDQAGINAAIKGVEIMLDAGINVRIVMLPDAKDPDSFMREQGHDAFQAFISDHEQDFLLFLAELRLKDVSTDPVKRTEFVHHIIRLLSHVEDPIKQGAYLQELHRLTQIDTLRLDDVLSQAIQQRNNEKKRRSSTTTEEKSPRPHTPGDSEKTEDYPQEKEVLRIIFQGGEQTLAQAANITVHDFILEQLRDIPSFIHPLYDRIYSDLLANQDQPFSIQYYITHPDHEIRELVNLLRNDTIHISDNWSEMWQVHLQTQPPPEENFYKDSLQATLQLKLARLQMMAAENAKVLQSTSDEDTLNHHLAIQKKLIELRHELSVELGRHIM